jgi:hypothetical protein
MVPGHTPVSVPLAHVPVHTPPSGAAETVAGGCSEQPPEGIELNSIRARHLHFARPRMAAGETTITRKLKAMVRQVTGGTSAFCDRDVCMVVVCTQ